MHACRYGQGSEAVLFIQMTGPPADPPQFYINKDTLKSGTKDAEIWFGWPVGVHGFCTGRDWMHGCPCFPTGAERLSRVP